KGHYTASCKYCPKTWNCGTPFKLKAHLANECPGCHYSISHFYLDEINNQQNNEKNRKQNAQTLLPNFYVKFLKQLRPAYEPPSFAHLESCFILILTENSDLIPNPIKRILRGYNFFSNIQNLSYIFKPMRDSVTVLQSENTNLADCYLQLVKLAAAVKKTPINTNSSYNKFCTNKFNLQWKEFNHEGYLLAYFLHPDYKKIGIRYGQYQNVAKIAATYWKSMQ
ncbi:7716_t:CDS:2, partial [Entrophospora sp. SA101]